MIAVTASFGTSNGSTAIAALILVPNGSSSFK
jgi:hypothetical protein